ncbi:MAG: carbohydrate ABC transporter permease [Thermomicrobiales bacterium]
MSVASIEEEIQASAPRVEGRSGSARMVRRHRPLLTLLRIVVLLLAALFFLLPVVWMVLTSFKMPGEYLHRPPIWIPHNPTLNHYRLALESGGQLALENSLVIASCATAISLIVGTLAAYSISRFETGGRHLSFWFLSQRMMPPVVVIVPLFLMLRDVGKVNPSFGLDTRFAMIAVYTAFNLPFIIWMMRSYFDGVPLELEESAMVDGSTRLGVFWRIALPLSLPGLIATGTFAFIFSWTEFLFRSGANPHPGVHTPSGHRRVYRHAGIELWPGVGAGCGRDLASVRVELVGAAAFRSGLDTRGGAGMTMPTAKPQFRSRGPFWSRQGLVCQESEHVACAL